MHQRCSSDARSSAPAAAAQPGQVARTILIHPQLASLPVFVRAGTVLPIEPLVESTNEIPQDPLTLRVYAGGDCDGSLYLDDGRTYAYRQGAYLRMAFHCQVTDNSFELHIGAHQGSYPARWKDINVEIYGWRAKRKNISVDGSATSLQWKQSAEYLSFTIEENGKGSDIELN